MDQLEVVLATAAVCIPLVGIPSFLLGWVMSRAEAIRLIRTRLR